MRLSLRRAGRHHTVVAAYLALFCALGGSAYAAFIVTSDDIVDETIQARDIGPDAVDNAEIRDDAVTQNKLRYDSVTSAKIANGQVTAPDVANGSLTGYDIADHSVKATDLDVSKVYATTDSAWDTEKTAYVSCGSGRTAIGGGGKITGPYGAGKGKIAITESVPSGSGWQVTAVTIDYPPVPEWKFSYDGDYVTGYEWWSKVDHFSYGREWDITAWAVCV